MLVEILPNNINNRLGLSLKDKQSESNIIGLDDGNLANFHLKSLAKFEMM